jgi:hypothetical protein
MTPTITLKDSRVTDVRYESALDCVGLSTMGEKIFARSGQ